MQLILPLRLRGRIYRAPTWPALARLAGCWMRPWGEAPPMPPASWNVDEHLPAGITLPPRVYLNDAEGDCVMAARANHQTRLLAGELGQVVTISDDEVNTEYFAETGGEDTGLVPEDSYAKWQNPGWTAGGAMRAIAAWARVSAGDTADVQRCIWMLQGMQVGMELPLMWREAINAGGPWDAPPSENADDRAWQLGSWGGHQVYAFAYDANGVWVWTWGQKQLITWAALAWAGAEANQGECAGIVRMNAAGEGRRGEGPVDGLHVNLLLEELAAIREAA